MRKPFFKASHNCRYFEHERGKQVRLDPDEEKAFKMWERMRQIGDYKQVVATVEAIFEAWLEQFKLKASPDRVEKAETGTERSGLDECRLARSLEG